MNAAGTKILPRWQNSGLFAPLIAGLSFVLALSLLAIVAVPNVQTALYDHRLRFFWGHQVIELVSLVPLTALVLELAYLAAFSICMALLPRHVVEHRGFELLFFSFLIYQILMLCTPQLWWVHHRFLDSALLTQSFLLLLLPLPGALNYALRLLAAHQIGKARGIEVLGGLKWWTVFAPTLSYAMAVCVHAAWLRLQAG